MKTWNHPNWEGSEVFCNPDRAAGYFHCNKTYGSSDNICYKWEQEFLNCANPSNWALVSCSWVDLEVVQRLKENTHTHKHTFSLSAHYEGKQRKKLNGNSPNTLTSNQSKQVCMCVCVFCWLHLLAPWPPGTNSDPSICLLLVAMLVCWFLFIAKRWRCLLK